MTEEEAKDFWNRFVEDLMSRIDECLEHGTPFRCSVGAEASDGVTIDIYRSKGSMKAFDEMVLAAAKEHRGMGIAPEPESEK